MTLSRHGLTPNVVQYIHSMYTLVLNNFIPKPENTVEVQVNVYISNPTFCLVRRAQSQSTESLLICHLLFPDKGCVALCIENMQRVQELSPLELVEMFVTVFCFLKDSSEVSQILLDDFRSCQGYVFLSEFLLQ